VNALRTKLVMFVFVACQLSLLLGCFNPVSWWDGP
jgi:hypothetical protein